MVGCGECTRCWYNERFQTCKELGKVFSSTIDKTTGVVEVYFGGEWAGMAPGPIGVCPNGGVERPDRLERAARKIYGLAPKQAVCEEAELLETKVLGVSC